MRNPLPEWAERLIDAHRPPPKSLILAIVGMHETARPTLLALARGEYAREDGELPDDGQGRLHALGLLGLLPPDAASIDVCLAILVETSYDPLSELATTVLEKWGEAVAGPALAAYRATSEPSTARVVSRCGVRSDEIYDVLVEQFEADPERGAPLLAEYGDPRALDAIHDVFERHELGPDEGMSSDQIVIELDAAVRALGGKLTPRERATLGRVHARRTRHLQSALEVVQRDLRRASQRQPSWSLVTPKLDLLD
jgi:hypothetical protein